MSAKKCFVVSAALALLSSVGVAVELPEGVKVAKDGSLSFPGGSVGVWVAQVGWMGAVRFAPADPAAFAGGALAYDIEATTE